MDQLTTVADVSNEERVEKRLSFFFITFQNCR
jgi:hypothetical protein